VLKTFGTVFRVADEDAATCRRLRGLCGGAAQDYSPDWAAERSQFELSGPFERELAFLRERISLAFVTLACLKGTGESKEECNSRENGPEMAVFSHFSVPY
jgi:hypothetical protein